MVCWTCIIIMLQRESVVADEKPMNSKGTCGDGKKHRWTESCVIVGAFVRKNSKQVVCECLCVCMGGPQKLDFFGEFNRNTNGHSNSTSISSKNTHHIRPNQKEEIWILSFNVSVETGSSMTSPVSLSLSLSLPQARSFALCVNAEAHRFAQHADYQYWPISIKFCYFIHRSHSFHFALFSCRFCLASTLP